MSGRTRSKSKEKPLGDKNSLDKQKLSKKLRSESEGRGKRSLRTLSPLPTDKQNKRAQLNKDDNNIRKVVMKKNNMRRLLKMEK